MCLRHTWVGRCILIGLVFNNIKLLQRILTKYYVTNNEEKVDSVHGM